MIVKAITNKESDLPKKFHDVAITQDEDGRLDITPGLHYLVYATKKNEYGEWFFVHTDEMNANTFWWMPAALYEIVDATKPEGWVEDSGDRSVYYAHPSLFDWQVEEGIIDGEEWAVQKYLKEVESDPSFPTQSQLDEVNKDFNRAKQQAEYQEKLKLARERGYEYPQKPTFD